MKSYLIYFTCMLAAMLLVSCASHRNPYPSSSLATETWMSEVDKSPNAWSRGADRWFFTGESNDTQEMNEDAPISEAISTMEVKVSNFTSIQTDGDFEVQIFGARDHNSVAVFGPNDGVRQVIVEVRGDTLYLRQPKNTCPNVRRTIVRIGIMNLKRLMQCGCGMIEGRQLHSTNLQIVSLGSGNIYLAGNMNLVKVTNRGSASVNVFGAQTTSLDIKTRGFGSVNVSGHVGVKSIEHHGCNDINLIGVHSNGLRVMADGQGKISINGHYNLCEVTAKDRVKVYSYCVNSGKLYAYSFNAARIGLAGYTGDLYVSAKGSSRFEGQHLYARVAYVKAEDNAHINVAASSRIFATASGAGSVYFYGPPQILTPFIANNALVMAMGNKHAAGICYTNALYKDGGFMYKEQEQMPLRVHTKVHSLKNKPLRMY